MLDCLFRPNTLPYLRYEVRRKRNFRLYDLILLFPIPIKDIVTSIIMQEEDVFKAMTKMPRRPINFVPAQAGEVLKLGPIKCRIMEDGSRTGTSIWQMSTSQLPQFAYFRSHTLVQRWDMGVGRENSHWCTELTISCR